MRKLCALAAASALFFGLSSVAAAAPVAVTYAIAPGGSISWTPSGAGTPGSGNLGGSMVVVYTSGSPTLGGTLGTAGQMQAAQFTFATPGTFFGGSVPGMGVGIGMLGTRTAGGAGNFGGATYIPVSHFTPGQPPVKMYGTGAIGFAALGSITISLNGAGTQWMSALPQTMAWTITGVTAAEVNRAIIPEPGTGVLLLVSLAGLAFVARRIRR